MWPGIRLQSGDFLKCFSQSEISPEGPIITWKKAVANVSDPPKIKGLDVSFL